jgi:hypothetical protein
VQAQTCKSKSRSGLVSISSLSQPSHCHPRRRAIASSIASLSDRRHNPAKRLDGSSSAPTPPFLSTTTSPTLLDCQTATPPIHTLLPCRTPPAVSYLPQSLPLSTTPFASVHHALCLSWRRISLPLRSPPRTLPQVFPHPPPKPLRRPTQPQRRLSRSLQMTAPSSRRSWESSEGNHLTATIRLFGGDISPSQRLTVNLVSQIYRRL